MSLWPKHFAMLGRKQSLRPEPILTDYGPDEALSDHADIEWVRLTLILKLIKSSHLLC